MDASWTALGAAQCAAASAAISGLRPRADQSDAARRRVAGRRNVFPRRARAAARRNINLHVESISRSAGGKASSLGRRFALSPLFSAARASQVAHTTRQPGFGAVRPLKAAQGQQTQPVTAALPAPVHRRGQCHAP
mmetsp:Transcript_27968/g.86502  ORF Transcript_27968/g.86502 Transcript_27968/m.86502 type:complete len:136 (+) Transcript_27968:957-1364(+)